MLGLSKDKWHTTIHEEKSLEESGVCFWLLVLSCPMAKSPGFVSLWFGFVLLHGEESGVCFWFLKKIYLFRQLIVFLVARAWFLKILRRW